jgi:D-alanyl-lipoteichoic acid acyltransferase DltB (MBOAT superfamily)
MLFNSIVFITFMAIVMPVFYLLKDRQHKKWWILFASYFFYGYWDWRFLGLLIFSSVMDFYLGKAIFSANENRIKKNWLIFSLIANLTILGVFKYYNFFVGSFQEMFSVNLDFLHLNVILPVGISFYTFQSLSYTFDVYRGRMKPEGNLLDYILFVAFFPQLVAGPIERAIDLLPQVKMLKNPRRSDVWDGFLLISLGMFKKVLIGDTIAKYVDHVFTDANYYSSPELLAALLMFAIQIYADFSGYSNIARGCAKLMGVDLVINFRQPYLSHNITDFWRRWHISLSSWLKEYLYIWGLGGNKRSKIRTYVNLLLTMLIGGFWHGANYTFIIWGGIHGLALAVHKWFCELTGNPRVTHGHYLAKMLGGVVTFIVVLFAWLFFRAPDLTTAAYFLESFIHWKGSDLAMDLFFITLSYYIVSFFFDFVEHRYGELFMRNLNIVYQLAILMPVWIVIVMYLFSIGKPMPFIYFQF